MCWPFQIYLTVEQLPVEALCGSKPSTDLDERLTLETLALKLFPVANLRYKLVDNTKLPCFRSEVKLLFFQGGLINFVPQQIPGCFYSSGEVFFFFNAQI